ncbi:hypothetical protein [Mycobacteroides abscessus]|uniref:hypothetical protein n=1 Tax=Mycobacteroides abscessus TaxID=36809 RepID=UPI00092CD87F|nr:hypothetical protein [Mycobacteroides abscessus]SIG30995.1 Uncharacterised protein [Mycobacteroides abscessus subsp. abscessus]SIH56646.1 Uncharacterised protein [Mycobacteroides abscessus subsp. abscessus]SIM80993.1 Uncharacterised protein [Mycobacteroides abscessus subsp. abscessus]
MSVLLEALALFIAASGGFTAYLLSLGHRRRGNQIQISGDNSVAIQTGGTITVQASSGSIAAHTIVGDVNVGGERWVGVEPNPLRRALLARSGPGQPLYMFGEVDSYDELPGMVNAATDHIGKWWWDRTSEVAYLWLGQGYKVLGAPEIAKPTRPDTYRLSEFVAQCACPRCGFINTHYIQPCTQDPGSVTRECTECGQTWRQQ